MSDTDVNLSSNMSLPIPVVGLTKGTDYATDLNSCLTLIDAHDHSTGNGVNITPSGININTDLSFVSNSATNMKKVVFTSQSAALTGTNFLSDVGGNMYWNDSSGNQIPITSGGGVAGSPGSIGSLAAPAAATYTAGSKLFTWTADTAKAAAMDNGAVTIRETNVASAKGVTLTSAASLAADYTITLPAALPASTQYLTSTSGGVTSFSTSDAIAAAMTSTGGNSVGTVMNSTGANAIAASRTRATGTSVAAGGVAISTSCSSFSTTSTSYVDVTNLSVTLISSGRPIFIGLVPDGSNISRVASNSTTSTNLVEAGFRIIGSVDGTVAEIYLAAQVAAVGGVVYLGIPPASISTIVASAAATNTWKLQACAKPTASTPTATVSLVNCKLIAYEL